jgi:hypothetical protein
MMEKNYIKERVQKNKRNEDIVKGCNSLEENKIAPRFSSIG